MDKEIFIRVSITSEPITSEPITDLPGSYMTFTATEEEFLKLSNQELMYRYGTPYLTALLDHFRKMRETV